PASLLPGRRTLQIRGRSVAAERLDQVPLAHLRAAPDVPLLRELVQLRLRPVLERVTCLAVPRAALRGLLAEVAPGGRIEVGDGALPARCGLRVADVLLRGLDLCLAGHLGLLRGLRWPPRP